LGANNQTTTSPDGEVSFFLSADAIYFDSGLYFIFKNQNKKKKVDFIDSTCSWVQSSHVRAELAYLSS
jgi:hypothetical protein